MCPSKGFSNLCFCFRLTCKCCSTACNLVCMVLYFSFFLVLSSLAGVALEFYGFGLSGVSCFFFSSFVSFFSSSASLFSLLSSPSSPLRGHPCAFLCRVLRTVPCGCLLRPARLAFSHPSPSVACGVLLSLVALPLLVCGAFRGCSCWCSGPLPLACPVRAFIL
jgi:hypothetical protein